MIEVSPENGGQKASFQPNRQVLSPGLRAPVPLEPNSRPTLQSAFRLLLSLEDTPANLREAAASTGGGLVHACQELVLASNRLLTQEGEALPKAVRTILWASRDLLGARNAVYVLEQSVETFPGRKGSASPDGFDGSKDLGASLERRLEGLGLPVRMSPERFGVLQVQLDETYDFAALQIQRFYSTLSKIRPRQAAAGEAKADTETTGLPAPNGIFGGEASAAFGGFARGFARAVKAAIPDYVLGLGAGPGRERTGLLDLLPELEREFI